MYLNCHSYHSLRYGTIPLQDLVQQAVCCGVKAMALTDINTVPGIMTCKDVSQRYKPLVALNSGMKHPAFYRLAGTTRHR